MMRKHPLLIYYHLHLCFPVTIDDGDIIELSGSVHVSGSESQLKVEGHITASGNISASGNILTSGNVTASGTGSFGYATALEVSASGIVKASSVRTTDVT